jgi:hypothetical protein
VGENDTEPVCVTFCACALPSRQSRGMRAKRPLRGVDSIEPRGRISKETSE